MIQYAYDNCPVCGKSLRGGFEWSLLSSEREAICGDCDTWALVIITTSTLTKILVRSLFEDATCKA